MKNDKERLIVLLKYLIGHNKEHGQELRELAMKAKGMVTETIQSHILEAAQRMDESVEFLMKALSELETY
jgi:hypothetical protein